VDDEELVNEATRQVPDRPVVSRDFIPDVDDGFQLLRS